MPALEAPHIRVLLVDDDDSLRRALVRAIRLAGFEVDAYRSVEALLQHGLPTADHCLVLDVDLPGLRGPEFRRALTAAGIELPTIFITALEPSEIGEPLEALAPLAVLRKPFSNDDLLDAIELACQVR